MNRMLFYKVKEGEYISSSYGVGRNLVRNRRKHLFCSYSYSIAPYPGRIMKQCLGISTDGGKTWTEEEIYSHATYSHRCGVIAIDSKDAIHVVWSGEGFMIDPDDVAVLYRKRTARGHWGNVELVSPADGPSSADPVVCIDSEDDIHVCWRDTRPISPENRRFIRYRKRTLSGWGAVENVTPEAISKESDWDPDMAVDLDDNVHIVWEEGFIPPWRFNIKYKKRTTSGWGQREHITTGLYSQHDSSISLDLDGNVYVVWSDWSDETGNRIMYRKKTSNWQDIEEIAYSDIPDIYLEDPSITVDLNKDIHVVWDKEMPPDAWGLIYRKKIFGEANWGQIIPLTERDNYFYGNCMDAIHPIISNKSICKLGSGFLLNCGYLNSLRTVRAVMFCRYGMPQAFWM